MTCLLRRTTYVSSYDEYLYDDVPLALAIVRYVPVALGFSPVRLRSFFSAPLRDKSLYIFCTLFVKKKKKIL